MTDAIRLLTRSLLATASLTALLVVAAPALGASPCAERIIDDWADNSVIDGTYEVQCYRQAIAGLPDDLRNYSSAADDINRALQALLRDEADPAAPQDAGGGSGGGSEAGGSDGGGSSSGSREPAGETSSDDSGGGAGPAATDGDGGQSGGAPQVGDGAVAAPSDALFERDLGDGGSSLPTPVIVLLAVAGAIALGAAAWLVRRQLGRRSAGG